MDEATPLTPLQLSRSQTGRRFYHCNPVAYQSISDSIDASRNFPDGIDTEAPTLRALPPEDSLVKSTKDWFLLSIETNRFVSTDDALLSNAISSGHLKELTEEESKALTVPNPENNYIL
jgi:hypothetical protein